MRRMLDESTVATIDYVDKSVTGLVARSELEDVEAEIPMDPVLDLGTNAGGDPIIELQYTKGEEEKSSPVAFDKDYFNILNDHISLNKPTVIWQNASPSSAFSAQTITIDYSKYNWIGIVFRTTSSLDSLITYMTPAISGASVFATGILSGQINRRYIYLEEDGIRFTDGGYLSSYGTQQFTTRNTDIVPVMIIGG